MTRGVVICSWIAVLAIGACTDAHEGADDTAAQAGEAGTAAPVRDGSVVDADPAAPATDAADVDASSGEQPVDPPPPAIVPAAPPEIAATEPLAGVLSFAFKAGYHGQEQIWLRGVDGALVRISDWDVGPDYDETCGASWSTGGYSGGRFGPLQFDPAGERLLFTEHVACHSTRNQQDWRVLAHDLRSGTTRVLAEAAERPSILVSADAVVIMVRHVAATFPAQPIRSGGIELVELVEGALRPIDVPTGGGWLRIGNGEAAHLLHHRDRALLLADGIPALEKVDGVWQQSELADALAGADISAVAASPSGDRLCAATSRVRPGGGREDTVAWVLDVDGDWQSTSLPGSGWVGRCFWFPDESAVAFDSSFVRIDAAGLVAIPLPGGTTIGVAGAWRGDFYGTDPKTRALMRIAGSTLEAETALAAEAMPPLCAGGLPHVRLPPDDRPLAIVKVSCGCIDCDISGSFAWHSERGTMEVVEEPWGEHDVYGVAWLADGGAVVLSTQSMGFGTAGAGEPRPEAASFFLVTADGAIETVGPLPDVVGTLHSPLAPPSSAP